MIVVTANGARTRSLGIIDNIPVNIGKIKIPTSFQVLESKDEILILGNDWLRITNATMSWEQSILTIKRGGITMKIPIAFTKTAKVVTQEAEDEYESEEYEDEYLEEYPIYLSDDVESEESELDDELGFNPWSDHYSPVQSEEDTDNNDELDEQEDDNPAVYLAEIAGYSAETDPTHLEQLGPLDYH